MGFTDKKYTNTSVISKEVGNALVGDGGAAGFKALADATSGIAEDLWARAEKENVALGTKLGESAISIGTDGKVSRDAMPPGISTQAGRDAFVFSQKSKALLVRGSAIRTKAAQLMIENQNLPDSENSFTEEFKKFVDIAIGEADPDIQKLLTIEAFQAGQKSLLHLVEVNEKKELDEGVAVATANISQLLSNITEQEQAGRSSLVDQDLLETNLQLAVKSGYKSKSQADAIRKSSRINVIAGGLYKKALKVDGRFHKVESQIFDELNQPDADKMFGLDMDGKDRSAIMTKVREIINHHQKMANVVDKEKTNKFSKVMVTLNAEWAKLPPNEQTLSKLDDMMAAGGITLEDREGNPFAASSYDRLLYQAVASTKAEKTKVVNQTIADFQTKLLTETDFGKIGKEIDAAKAAGLFEDNPTAYNALITLRVSRFLTTKKLTDENVDELLRAKYNEAAYKGELTERMLNEIAVRKNSDGQFTKEALWVLKNRSQLRTDISHNDGGREEYNIANLKLAEGLSPNATGVGYANTIIDYEIERAKETNKPNPYDLNTEGGLANILAFTHKAKVVPKILLDHVQKTLVSGEVKQVQNTIGIYERIKVDSSIRASILATIPEAIQNKLANYSHYFTLNGTNADQSGFAKYVEKLESTNNNKVVRQDLIKSQLNDPNFISNAVNTMLSNAGEKEQKDSAEISVSGFMLAPRDIGTWLWRKYKPPVNKPTPSEIIVSKDQEGDTAFVGQVHKYAPIDQRTAREITNAYKVERLNLPVEDEYNEIALEAVLGKLVDAKRIGPTNFPPLGQNVENGIQLSRHPIEAYFGSEKANDLVADFVTKFTKSDNIKKGINKELPPVMRNWITDIAFDSLMSDGYIRLQPLAGRPGTWSVYIVDPNNTDKNYNPLDISGDKGWTPTEKDYNEIKHKEFLLSRENPFLGGIK